MYQGASLWVDAWQCARTYGVQRPGKTSGAYNRSLSRLSAVGTWPGGQARPVSGPRTCRRSRESIARGVLRQAARRRALTIRSGRSDPGVTAGSRAAGTGAERRGLTSSDSHVPRVYLWYTFCTSDGPCGSTLLPCARDGNRRFGLRPRLGVTYRAGLQHTLKLFGRRYAAPVVSL